MQESGGGHEQSVPAEEEELSFAGMTTDELLDELSRRRESGGSLEGVIKALAKKQTELRSAATADSLVLNDVDTAVLDRVNIPSVPDTAFGDAEERRRIGTEINDTLAVVRAVSSQLFARLRIIENQDLRAEYMTATRNIVVPLRAELTDAGPEGYSVDDLTSLHADCLHALRELRNIKTIIDDLPTHEEQS